MRKSRPIHLGKKGYKTLWPIMTPEERHKRNGDRNVDLGFSSTGVELPSGEAKTEYHGERQTQRIKTGTSNLEVGRQKLIVYQDVFHKK